MKYKRMKLENFRKFTSSDILEFGKKITVISGINGIGKSSLLAILASTSGTNDKRINGLPFQPEFTELFSIDKNEDYDKYKIFVEFDNKIDNPQKSYYLTKRISFKNDVNSGRGIRLIPRTCPPIDNDESKYKLTVKEAQDDDEFGSGSKRVPVPTEYVSLSRLVPLGESNVTFSKIRNSNKIIKNGSKDFFKKCYNSVLDNSISDDSTPIFVSKGVGSQKREHLSLNPKDTTEKTLSVGQDNLEALTAAFTDFYALRAELGEKYQGGILCIDEIDASLHPSAVKKLWTLLKNLTDELNLQIILTSHSLVILKEICKSQMADPENYRLLYFKDNEHPRLSENTEYEILKADMFDQITVSGPKIKIYCEDNITKKLFDLLEYCLKKKGSNKKLINYFNYYDFCTVGVKLGKDHLNQLPKEDDYFRTVLILLDGDAKLKSDVDPNVALHKSKKDFEKGRKSKKATCDNIVRLPTFYSPENYIFKVLEEVCDKYNEYNNFWSYIDNIPELSNYTVPRLRKKFRLKDKDLTYKDIHDSKSWMNDALDFVDKSHLLVYYYKNNSNINELISFENELLRALGALRKTKSRNLFE